MQALSCLSSWKKYTAPSSDAETTQSPVRPVTRGENTDLKINAVRHFGSWRERDIEIIYKLLEIIYKLLEMFG